MCACVWVCGAGGCVIRFCSCIKSSDWLTKWAEHVATFVLVEWEGRFGNAAPLLAGDNMTQVRSIFLLSNKLIYTLVLCTLKVYGS